MRRTSPRAVSGSRETGADRLVPRLARGGGHNELLVLREQNEEVASVRERASALDDELEDPVQVGLSADRTRDRDSCLEPAHRTLELSAASVDVLVQVGVLDRDRHPAREDEQRLLVGLVELAALLLGQVDVAPGLAAHQHRGAEEGRHRRVLWREAVAARVLADVGQAKRLGMADQLAEDAAAAGQLADRAPRGLIDAGGEEALELLAVLVEDADGRVARSGQLAAGFEHALQHRLAVQLGDYRGSDFEQKAEPLLIQSATIHGPTTHGSQMARPAPPARSRVALAAAARRRCGFEPGEVWAELFRDDLLIGGPGRRVEDLGLEALGTDGMRAHEDRVPPREELAADHGVEGRGLRLRSGEHGDRRCRRVGHLRAEPAMLDRVVGGVAGGEHPPARSGNRAVLVDRQEAVSAGAGQSADRTGRRCAAS